MREFEAEVLERLSRLEALLRGNGGPGVMGKLEDHERRLRGLEVNNSKVLVFLGIWQTLITGALAFLLVEALKKIF